MKVFISWSGDRSLKVAEFLDGWIRCVIQAAKPWVSSQAIDRGAVWFAEISEQLKDTSIGIICLTAENKEKPWIMFETGALAKGLTQARVCPLLIDLQPTDVKDPLAQFNLVTPDNAGIWKLVQTLNGSLPDPLPHNTLRKVFDLNWPEFASQIKSIVESTVTPKKVPARETGDILSEILQNTRSLQRRISNLENVSLITPDFAPAALIEKITSVPRDSDKLGTIILRLVRENYPHSMIEEAALRLTGRKFKISNAGSMVTEGD